MKKYISIFSICIVFTNFCFSQTPLTKKQKLSDEEYKYWWYKDYTQDTIAGTSLDRAYKELLQNKKGREIIVAVLDTKLDIFHEDLKDQIWVNEDEIPDNGIDDDNNGYVDDVNGWDFLSNDKGEFLAYENAEIVRVIRKYDPIFKGKKLEDIAENQKQAFQIYIKAKSELETSLNVYKVRLKNTYADYETFQKAQTLLQKMLKKEKFTSYDLYSLQKIEQKDTLVLQYVNFMKKKLRSSTTLESLKDGIEYYENGLYKTYNIDYNEREIVGDNDKNINDKFYGYHKVHGRVPFEHSIGVSGVIGARRDNNIGIQGISNNIKIMPIVMVASGDEHDKDIALAIRYAVDNGASVINMSWGKDYSTHQNWVHDAMKYAEKHDVLLVKSAGNLTNNIDVKRYFLSDYIEDKEVVTNCIMVGASNYNATEKLSAYFSNYGKNNVDIFAPGVKMYTTKSDNEYEYSRGTSVAAPVVSGISAMIRSYYPNLTASEVKMILMESGSSFDLKVRIYNRNGKNTYLPFSELSKSGKIVNAYNALLLAEKVSNAKK